MSDTSLDNSLKLTERNVHILVVALVLALFVCLLLVVLLIVCIRYKKRSESVDEVLSTDEKNVTKEVPYCVESAQKTMVTGTSQRPTPLVTISQDIVDMETNQHYHCLRMEDGGVDSPESITSLHSIHSPRDTLSTGYNGEETSSEQKGGQEFLKPHLRLKGTCYSLEVRPLFDNVSQFMRTYSENHIDYQKDDYNPPLHTRFSSTGSSLNLTIIEIEPSNIVTDGTLGMGQFGQVHLAHTRGLSAADIGIGTGLDRTKSHEVAVKFLNQNATEKDLKCFQKEVKYMSRLRHRNVVQILAVCWGEEKFIMLEYMKNGDLQSFLQFYKSVNMGHETYDRTLSYFKLVDMSLQIADAMKYLSSCKFIHRDLAARNCLVGDNFLVKVADFGLSKNLYDSCYYRFKGSAILPIRWMAPECFYGRFSEKSDVWGFGVTFWEIFNLCLERPYTSMTDEQIIERALNGTLKVLDKPECCKTDLYQIMTSCLRPRAADRPNFEELHTRLSSFHHEHTLTE